ncbi:hypothetical protein RS86_00020 [Microbacterium azadirachtae]|uniref:Uncharacterized protein n=1 Tax=Microbacterium azadirachtae TaxID=582680 RepID=A0A0F0LX49_9MICO|nr:hypothetical protein RS86_00020 [Microbacterium azadirachtae]
MRTHDPAGEAPGRHVHRGGIAVDRRGQRGQRGRGLVHLGGDLLASDAHPLAVIGVQAPSHVDEPGGCGPIRPSAPAPLGIEQRRQRDHEEWSDHRHQERCREDQVPHHGAAPEARLLERAHVDGADPAHGLAERRSLEAVQDELHERVDEHERVGDDQREQDPDQVLARQQPRRVRRTQQHQVRAGDRSGNGDDERHDQLEEGRQYARTGAGRDEPDRLRIRRIGTPLRVQTLDVGGLGRNLPDVVRQAHIPSRYQGGGPDPGTPLLARETRKRGPVDVHRPPQHRARCQPPASCVSRSWIARIMPSSDSDMSLMPSTACFRPVVSSP